MNAVIDLASVREARARYAEALKEAGEVAADMAQALLSVGNNALLLSGPVLDQADAALVGTVWHLGTEDLRATGEPALVALAAQVESLVSLAEELGCLGESPSDEQPEDPDALHAPKAPA